MQIGALRHRITIQKRSTEENSLGELVGGWVPVATTWADAQPIRGRDYFTASQEQSVIDVKFVIRYREGVTDEMRVIWNGEPYAIQSPPIDVAGRMRTLELMCTKGIKDADA